MKYLETYNASEGFFGLQDDPEDASMLLMLDYGVYYEFLPMSELGKTKPRTLLLEEVETGVNYALIITTNGGLWRYMIGDTIQFTSVKPYKFIEFNTPPADPEYFAGILDQELQKLNSDYEAKRLLSLERLRLHIARPGLFNDWLKEKGKLGGQHKVPRLWNDRTHLEELLLLDRK